MRGSATAPKWLGRLRLAAAFGLVGSDVPTIALAGFLIRGGIVVLLLPGIVLPSYLAIAGATGSRALTLSGDPTPWFIAVIAVVATAVIFWLLLSVVIGSLVDVWMVRAALAPDGDIDRSLPTPGAGLLVRLASIRLACLAPLAVALIWAGGRIYTATYNELLTPSDLAVALPVRIVGDAADAVAVVVGAWLVCETIAAIAVRRLILNGGSVWRTIPGAVAQFARRPIWTLLTVATSVAAGGAAVAVAFFGIATSYGWAAVASRSEDPIAIKVGFGALATTRDFRPVVFLLAVVAVAAAWIVALIISGVASAWRSAAFTHEVVAALGRDAIEPAAPGAQQAPAVVDGTTGIMPPA
jgi:hypothetical protein